MNTPIQMKHIDISVGIPVHNGVIDIDQCLQSIYENEKDIIPTLEVIIVDDGSDDGTSEMIKKKYPKATLSRNNENMGVSYSTKFIIDSMNGDYLLRLDSDTIVNAEAINRMYDFMQSNASVGACTVQLVGVDGDIQINIEEKKKGPGMWFFDYALWLKKMFQKYTHKKSYSTPTEIAYMGTGAVLFKAETVKEVGGLDEEIPFYMEDADWILRVAATGKKIYFIPDVTIIHVGGMSGYLYIQTRGRSLKSLFAFYRKHYPGFINTFKLTLGIVSGSFIGLVMAIIVLPFGIINRRIREISVRAFKSYVNVFMWFIARKYSIS